MLPEDAAAAIGMDALEFFLKNLELAPEALRGVYREELGIAAEMINYKRKAHLRGDGVACRDQHRGALEIPGIVARVQLLPDQTAREDEQTEQTLRQVVCQRHLSDRAEGQDA